MTGGIQPGVYEELITSAVEARLGQLLASEFVERSNLSAADAADRLALHVSEVVARVIDSIPLESRSDVGLQLTRQLIADLEHRLSEHGRTVHLTPDLPAQLRPVLHAVWSARPDGSPDRRDRPLTPVIDSALLTNAPGEPRVGRQIASEFATAHRIDLIMAFIRTSGIRDLLTLVEEHTSRGRPIRVLTTTYTGSTQLEALEQLVDRGADVRVSYDEGANRLHAKAWIFHRPGRATTTYLGSSNLTFQAQVTGLEWNVRLAARRNLPLVEKMVAVFDTYWDSGDFEVFDTTTFRAHRRASMEAPPTLDLAPFELHLRPFQEHLLRRIERARGHGRHRNLLVAATGTGKTVMAAVDFRRMKQRGHVDTLLVVAHRAELLEQARRTFRSALMDPTFGELWLAGRRPERFRHVFASVQTLANADLAGLDPQHFDMVIVDEFHHAAAPTYERLLRHAQPRELLGLTATPERADGLPVLHWFDDRIAAELRLWDAIDAGQLVPFRYLGISDGVSLESVRWRPGRGYDPDQLAGVYTADHAWAGLVLRKLRDNVDDLREIRALGFCVSVRHAEFMARAFSRAGVAAVAVSGGTSEDARRRALDDLRSGAVQVVFSVDLFNEGIDLPRVDTLLFLRPTESATVFLQQLGRGLRRAPGKTVCTVLDFVAQHRREFRFDRTLRGLLGGTRQELIRQVEDGFPLLPAGCHMEFDEVARDVVLRNIRAAIPSTWRQRIDEVRAQARSGQPVTLESYLAATGLELGDVYAGGHSWTQLRQVAGLAVADAGPDEERLRRAVGRMLHVDDEVRLGQYHRWLSQAHPPVVASLPAPAQRLLRMLVVGLLDNSAGPAAVDDLQGAAAWVWRHRAVCRELAEVLELLARDPDVSLKDPLVGRPRVPLSVHARYSRLEILAALDANPGRLWTPTWREGVRYSQEESADVFVFTLDKSDGSYSPTTRYRDYAISPSEIHWESQSTTAEASPTGQRYINHASRGSAVLLFARLSNLDRAFWFLGTARYVGHEGERPMAIRWRLDTPLPGQLFTQFAAAVA